MVGIAGQHDLLFDLLAAGKKTTEQAQGLRIVGKFGFNVHHVIVKPARFADGLGGIVEQKIQGRILL